MGGRIIPSTVRSSIQGTKYNRLSRLIGCVAQQYNTLKNDRLHHKESPHYDSITGHLQAALWALKPVDAGYSHFDSL